MRRIGLSAGVLVGLALVVFACGPSLIGGGGLENPDVAGLRYPVVWPRSTSWQEEPAGVVLPNGEVALLGAAVYGGGGYHADPERIESVAGIEGAALVMGCAEEPFREVAVFNPDSHIDVTG